MKANDNWNPADVLSSRPAADQYDRSSMQLIGSWPSTLGAVASAGFSPSGHRYWTGGIVDAMIRVYDTESGTFLHEFRTGQYPNFSARILSDEMTLCSLDHEARFRNFDLQTGNLRFEKGCRCGVWPDKLPQHFQFYYPFTNDFYYTPLTLATYLLPTNASAEETRRWHEKYDPLEQRLVATKDEPENFQKELISLYQEQYEEAEEIYEKAAASFATCRYIGTVGNESVHPDIRPILDLHDEATKALSREEPALA